MRNIAKESTPSRRESLLSIAGPGSKWLYERFVLFIKVVGSPEKAFHEDLRGPSYLVPLVTLALFSIIISSIQAPVHADWIQYELESQGMKSENVAASLDLVGQTGRVMAAVSPLLLLVRFLLVAAVLWMWALPAEDTPGFQQLLNIVAYSYLPITMRNLTSGLILRLRSQEALHTATGLSVPLGLDLFWRDVATPWLQLIGKINIFEAWFILLLVLGVAGVKHTTIQKALWVVIPSWLSITAVQIGFAYLGFSIQNQ
jgi:hypothetical protein